MINVYMWPFKGISEWGHASMDVDDGSPPGTCYISWWPDGENISHPDDNIGYCSDTYTDRKYEIDKKAEGDNEPSTLSFVGLDESKIKAYWLDLLRSKEQYCTTRFNCSSAVYQALLAGGAAPRNVTPAFWTPQEVFKYAQEVARALQGTK
jgi:hypothetical protein